MKKALIFLFCAFLHLNLSSAEYSYNTSQTSDLKSKLNGKLAAGDIVYLEDGTYNNLQLIFKGTGTESKPITLKAKNQGKVILTGGISIKMSGKYLVVDGLILLDGMAATGADIIEFRTSSTDLAYNCRLTNTVIDNCNNPDESYRDNADKSERWVMLYGKNNRIDHCYFTNKINGGVLIMANINAVESRENNHIIDYNYFSHRPRFAPGNNAEIIRTGDSHTSQYSCKTIIENNFFYACDGEVEIISIKSCDNIVRKNVFYESEGGVVCRHGHRNTIESNAFIGNNKKSCGGVRIINEGHKVYNNYFQDLPGTGSRSALCVMTALFETPTASTDLNKEPLNTYHRVKDVDICYNTFVNCANIDLGTVTSYTYPSTNPYYPNETIKGTLKPICNIARNVFYNTSVNNILNLVSPNTSEITFSNNIYRFKKTIPTNGFTSRSLDYTSTTSDYGKGIYVLRNNESNILDAPNSSELDFSYISIDISGKNRLSRSIGALEFTNRELPFVTVKPSECGVTWYRPLENDINTVKSKTDFWENASGITSDKTLESTIQIIQENQNIKITSDNIISDVYIYNISGNLISSNQINNTLGSIDCSHFSSEIYLFQISTQQGTITKKVLIK